MTRAAGAGVRGVVAVAAVLAACRGATSPALFEDGYLHPMLAPDAATAAPRTATAAAATGGRSARPAAQAPGGAPGAAPGPGLPASASLPLADSDPVRAEVVVSARRLVGVEKSFDERSFLGHVLRVNALLPAGANAADYTAEAHLRRARADGKLVEPAAARPGDVILFECPSGCGAAGQGGVGAAVVEHVEAGRLDLIAYTGDVVRRCWAGTGNAPAGDRPKLDKVLGVAQL